MTAHRSARTAAPEVYARASLLVDGARMPLATVAQALGYPQATVAHFVALGRLRAGAGDGGEEPILVLHKGCGPHLAGIVTGDPAAQLHLLGCPDCRALEEAMTPGVEFARARWTGQTPAPAADADPRPPVPVPPAAHAPGPAHAVPPPPLPPPAVRHVLAASAPEGDTPAPIAASTAGVRHVSVAAAPEGDTPAAETVAETTADATATEAFDWTGREWQPAMLTVVEQAARSRRGRWWRRLFTASIGGCLVLVGAAFPDLPQVSSSYSRLTPPTAAGLPEPLTSSDPDDAGTPFAADTSAALPAGSADVLSMAVLGQGRAPDDRASPADTGGASPAAPADDTEPDAAPPPQISEPPPAAVPVRQVDPYDVTTWEVLASCESSGNWTANTGNGYYGGLQFRLESWVLVGGDGMPHEAPPDEQVRRAIDLWEIQGWAAWPDCSRTLGYR